MARIALLLIVITTLAGITPIGVRMCVHEIPPLLLGGLRFGLAGLLLWITVRLRGKRLPLSRNNMPLLLLLGLLAVPINQIGFLIGIKYANGSHASIFYALTPVLVFWFAVLLKRSTFQPIMLIAAMLAFAGAASVMWPEFMSDLHTVTDGSGTRRGSYLVGDMFLLLAVTTWAMFVTLSRPMIQREGPLRTLAAVFLVGTIMHIPLVIWEQTMQLRFDPALLTWSGVAGYLYIAIMTSYVNYLLIYVVIARYEVTRAMIVVNAQVLITTAAEWYFYDEQISGWFFVGTGLILAAIALDALRPKAKPTAIPAAATIISESPVESAKAG